MFVLMTLTIWVSGCGRSIGLVPTPIAYQDERVKELWQPQETLIDTTIDIFYATDRKPAGKPGRIRYPNSKEGPLMLGTATMVFGGEDVSWQQIVELSFKDTREQYTPVLLKQVNQFGALTETVTSKQADKHPELLDASGQTEFIEQVNNTLAAAKDKIINVYVHGSVVNFMHPMKVSAGFFHYLDRKGVMIAYAWRTKPGVVNYVGDIRRAESSVPKLAALIEFLAANTDTERINLISYSAGGRLLGDALVKIREDNSNLSEQQLFEKYRIGTVLFASSDIDLETFSSDMLPRLYDLPKEITVTLNGNDGTLSLSKFLYGASRVGNPNPDELTPEMLEELAARMEEKLTVIDVAEALELRDGGKKRGHDYWYRNDWVLTEVLASMVWDLPPDERGLVRDEGQHVYHFPPDYPDRIVKIILERNILTQEKQ